jgi:hypothetical protein
VYLRAAQKPSTMEPSEKETIMRCFARLYEELKLTEVVMKLQSVGVLNDKDISHIMVST